MDLNQLHQFLVVAETENITKAAQKLYITQPALSRAISRLESELEVNLFDRKTNALILNENGQIFLQHVSVGLDAINSGVHAVRQRNVNRKVIVANYIFLDEFASFCDRCLSEFPDVDLEAFDGSRSVSDYPTDIVPDLTIIPEKAFRGYSVVKAYVEPWCVMYNQNYVFQSDCDGSSITVDQLLMEPIFFDNSPYDKSILTKLFGEIPPNIHFATQPDESRTTISRSRCVGIVPVSAYMSLKKRVPDTPVRIMPVEGIRLERSIYLSHRPNFLDSAEGYDLLAMLDRHVETELVAAMDFLKSSEPK